MCVCVLSVQRVCGLRRFLRLQLLLQVRAAYGYVVQCRCACERSGSGVTANTAYTVNSIFSVCSVCRRYRKNNSGCRQFQYTLNCGWISELDIGILFYCNNHLIKQRAATVQASIINLLNIQLTLSLSLSDTAVAIVLAALPLVSVN